MIRRQIFLSDGNNGGSWLQRVHTVGVCLIITHTLVPCVVVGRPRHNERALSHKEHENTEMIQRFSREYAIFKELLTVVEILRNAPGRERTVRFCGYQGLLQGGGTRVQCFADDK